jgi:hypothetical protein
MGLGVVDLDGWVALRGKKPRESQHDGARYLGSYSEAGLSLRKVCALESMSSRKAHDSKTARWPTKATRRERSTNTALERGEYLREAR